MVGKETVINGDVQSKSDIRIDGILKGSVNTKGKLVVGSSGVVEGDVVCENADISGEIKAKIGRKRNLILLIFSIETR